VSHVGVPFDTYSNFGYTLLGLIIEYITGKSYEKFVQSQVFGAAGSFNPMPQIGVSAESGQLPGEVFYVASDGYGHATGTSILTSHNPPDVVPFPYGVFNLYNMDSAAGWVMSPVDWVMLLAGLHNGNTKLLSSDGQQRYFSGPTNGTPRIGCWDNFINGAYIKGGLLAGTGTLGLHFPAKNLSIAFFANSSISPPDFNETLTDLLDIANSIF
jgi:CubicO group peptidase (beta-lactamase class C family)